MPELIRSRHYLVAASCASVIAALGSTTAVGGELRSARRRSRIVLPAACGPGSILAFAHVPAERFVGTLHRECLDHLLILGEQHLREILAEYPLHYNAHRPHQGLQQRPPPHRAGDVTDITARIERRRVVGGLISEYRRAA